MADATRTARPVRGPLRCRDDARGHAGRRSPAPLRRRTSPSGCHSRRGKRRTDRRAAAGHPHPARRLPCPQPCLAPAGPCATRSSWPDSSPGRCRAAHALPAGIPVAAWIAAFLLGTRLVGLLGASKDVLTLDERGIGVGPHDDLVITPWNGIRASELTRHTGWTDLTIHLDVVRRLPTGFQHPAWVRNRRDGVLSATRAGRGRSRHRDPAERPKANSRQITSTAAVCPPGGRARNTCPVPPSPSRAID